MSEVKRYDPGLWPTPQEIIESPCGEYVKYEDYERLMEAIKDIYVSTGDSHVADRCEQAMEGEQ